MSKVSQLKAAKKAVDKVVHSNKMRTYIPAGQAKAGPPLGPMLGQRAINIAAFCKDFNERTKNIKEGIPLPCRIKVRPDRSYELIIHKPPMSYYVKQAAGCERAAMQPGREVSGKISLRHVYEIACIKKEDPVNEMASMEVMCKMVIAAARSCGIEVVHRLEAEEYQSFLNERKLINEQQLKELEEKKQAKMLRTA